MREIEQKWLLDRNADPLRHSHLFAYRLGYRSGDTRLEVDCCAVIVHISSMIELELKCLIVGHGQEVCILGFIPRSETHFLPDSSLLFLLCICHPGSIIGG